MLAVSMPYLDMNNSLARTVTGRVELYDGSTLAGTYSHIDALQSIHVERAGEVGKFFGFGICQKLTVKLVAKDVLHTPVKGNKLLVYFKTDTVDEIKVGPDFFIDAVVRDEKTKALTVTAYDKLHAASVHKFSELGLKAPYTIKQVAESIRAFLGLDYYIGSFTVTHSAWTREYPQGANLSGEETLRQVLDAIAEATQCIYHVRGNKLIFLRLETIDRIGLTIEQNQYFELTTEQPVTLSGICHVTDLNDNVQKGSGVIQYVKSNPFWENRLDITDIIDEAYTYASGLTIYPFNCTWRGNFVGEFGDQITLRTKSGTYIRTYLLNDSFEYTGGFKETTSWSYEEQEAQTATPTTIGQKINQTSARIDRANNQITLLASSVNEQGTNIGQLQVTDDSIRASVEALTANTQISLDGVHSELGSLSQRVETSMTASQVEMKISETLANGVDSVTTSTGFTFDNDGLKIKKSTSDMESLLDETGLRVSRRGTEMLKATSDGVDARNLTAQEYLRIENIRFERYNRDRMGCFWVGG